MLCQWRNVWFVPPGHAWQRRLAPTDIQNHFFGTQTFNTMSDALARGEQDVHHFIDELGMAVRYCGPAPANIGEAADG